MISFKDFQKSFIYTGIPIKDIENIEKYCSETFKDALSLANEGLKKKNISVFFIQQLPGKPGEEISIDYKKNILLGIKSSGIEEPIDIVDIKALDEKSIKSKEALAKEMIKKVNQHITAKKIGEILISSSGSKLDTRKIEKHKIEIDEKGYLRIDENRICYKSGNSYLIIKASSLRSYTIAKVIEENGKLKFFDDYDLVRLNNKGMFINLEKILNISKKLIEKESKKDAEDYTGKYFELERYILGNQEKKHLYEVLKTFYSLDND